MGIWIKRAQANQTRTQCHDSNVYKSGPSNPKHVQSLTIGFENSISPPLYVWIALQTVSFSSFIHSSSSIISQCICRSFFFNFSSYLRLDLQMRAVSASSLLRFSISGFSKLISVSAFFFFLGFFSSCEFEISSIDLDV